MGQEQSLAAAPDARQHNDDPGVRVVEGSGTSLSSSTKSQVDKLLQDSASLPLPQPLLPPPTVKDDVSSALQGAQMMHELRTLFGGLLESLDLNISPATAPPAPTPPPDVELRPVKQGAIADTSAPEKSEATHQSPSNNEQRDTPAASHATEHANLGVLAPDAAAVDQLISDCTGTTRLDSFVDTQQDVLEQILRLSQSTTSLQAVVDENIERARRTSKALEKLERMRMAVADVQESLEHSVATANILGAAHFADDDEMCSFKNFLKYNPPRYS